MFTSYQKQIMQDTEFLLQKREVILKVEQLWLHLQKKISAKTAYIAAAENALGIEFQPAKITKGENYLGLPYVVCDHPRYFKKEDIFTFRSMFWWGNFFSFSVFVLGEPLENIRTKISLQKLLKIENAYIGTGKNTWQYEYSPDNYTLINEIGSARASEIISAHPFMKLSVKIPVTSSETDIVTFGEDAFEKFWEVLFEK